MARILLTHVPDMLENYYGPRALAEMRKLGEVRLNTSGKVLDAKALADAAKGCEIIVSDRQTPGAAEFFPLAVDCCAFLRVAVDIRNIDVEAASREGVLVTRATPGFMASVSEMAIGMMIDCARGITDASVSHPSAGVYCIDVDGGAINVSGTIDSAAPAPGGTFTAGVLLNTCPAGKEVEVKTYSGGAPTDLPFYLLVN